MYFQGSLPSANTGLPAEITSPNTNYEQEC